MNILEQIVNCKSNFCIHENGCIIAALKITLQNAKYGLIISGVIQFIRTLKMMIKNSASFKATLNPQYLTIALYMSATVLSLRVVRCGLRKVRGVEDGVNSLVAGGVAGWVASQTLNEKYWYFYLTFIGARVIGAIHKWLIALGVLKEESSHWHIYFMMTIAHMVHSYGYFVHPFLLKDDMYSLYMKMSTLTHNEKKWHLASLKYNHRRIVQIFGSNPLYDNVTVSRMKALAKTIKREQLNK